MTGDDELRIRAATLEDVPAILDLEQACFQSLDETFNRRQIRALIANPRATVTVAEAEGKVMGWSVGLVRQHRKSRSGRLYAIAVHPRGPRPQARPPAGRAHAGRAGRPWASSAMYLEVRADNESAIALYRKLGFVDHCHLPTYYGPGRDAQRMKLKLPTAS